MIRVAHLFSQFLHQLQRAAFEKLVVTHSAERGAKGFSCWTQLVAMLFGHVAQADSLREICGGLAGCLGKRVHLGVSRNPSRSTLAYANEHRPAALYEAFFWQTLDRFRSMGILGCRKPKFQFKNKLLSMDSTLISLCLSLFPWAKYRRAKGGVKLHVGLDHDDYLPFFCNITEGRRHDIVEARKLSLKPGCILVFDRGYNDYRFFGRWCDEGVFFVTRLKEGSTFEVVEDRAVPQNRNILRDQVIRLTSDRAEQDCPHNLRRIEVWDARNERIIVLLTNHLSFGSSTLAAIYKDRWEIELFFKVIKQHLKVKTFVGTSENALRIQIWTALLALLLFRWLYFLSKAKWSFSNLVSLLRFHLFSYRPLEEWLDSPYDRPPVPPEFIQAELLPGLGQLAA